VRWTKLAADEVQPTWDAQLLRFRDQSLFQSVRWGQYKGTRGWAPHYFRADADGVVVAMLQALVRRYPLRTVVAWCPGGPVGCLDTCSSDSMKELAEQMEARRLYCRASFLRIGTRDEVQYLSANGWSRPGRPVGAGTTAVWDLRQSEEQLLAGLNRNWRYSLRQAQQRNLRVERFDAPPVRELAQLCRSMNAAKGIGGSVEPSEVAALFEALGDRALVYGCRNQAGELVAFHACAIQGDRAWELVAATSDEARRSGASFVLLWTMMLECRGRGVTHFDLAGVDHVRAPGVASFKRWTGAEEVEWLGEWEWSSSRLLRRVVNIRAARRSTAALP